MNRILGLDLGVGSIGWALIDMPEREDENGAIIGMGSRIIPLSKDETTGFTKGNGETLCSQRTAKRSIRRMNDRFKQRRDKIKYIFNEIGIQENPSLLKLSPIEMWRLRAKAAGEEKVTLEELARIVLHINSRRGYRDSKSDGVETSKSAYLESIRGRAGEAKSKNQTPGQYFYEKLKHSEYQTAKGKAYNFRIKEEVFPRKSYEDELSQILKFQQQFHPDVLNDLNVSLIQEAVFYQRPLKSCKHLVSICEFESRTYTNEKGEEVISGPRVAPVTSPLAQVCRMWEAVNNIQLKNYKNKQKIKSGNSTIPGLMEENPTDSFIYPINKNQREEIFNFLNSHESLKANDIFKILGLKKDDGFSPDKLSSKGIKGNQTRFLIGNAIKNIPDYERFLSFDLKIVDSGKVDETTGEMIQKISSDYLKEPLYRLWHTVYSIDDFDELKKVLKDKFNIEDEEAVVNLFNLDFRGKGYTNKSAKFMCRLLPYLMQGYKYNEACEILGINHSHSLTKEENKGRIILDELPLLKKGELRQPVVEKILNQLIHLVNNINKEYGKIDSIKVEMARTLKQSKEEREKDFLRINKLESENKKITSFLTNEMGMRPTRNRIQKVRMWRESANCCMYCGQPIGLKEFLSGIDAEKEHIIPRSLYFNDGFSNKVCSCRSCNSEKGQQTGYDYMKSRSPEKFNAYMDRVEMLYNKYKTSGGKEGISKTKHDLLLTSKEEIPQDFIERDLRQTQYISRKAIELLNEICRDVMPTSGSVTSFLRHVWGYDEILHYLNLPRFSKAGQTEIIEFEKKGNSIKEERIEGWSKREDHRHHAIDALVIALTTRGQIQRFNALNAESVDENEIWKKQNIEKWASGQFHFPFKNVCDETERIAVSFKSGKKVTTPGKRYVKKGGKRILAQTGIQVPRGPLTEGTVYGVIQHINPSQPLKFLFKNPEKIKNREIRNIILKRLSDYSGNESQAIQSIKKLPLLIKGDEKPVLEADCIEKEIVIKRPITSITLKNKDKIVDLKIREIVNKRFEATGNNDKSFLQSLEENPLFLDESHNIPIKKIRCYTGLSVDSVTPVKWNQDKNEIGFAKYGNNHHIAIYEDENGKWHETVVPMTHAVKRKLEGLPVIVTNPSETWNLLEKKKEIDENFISKFPLPGWKFKFSMQQNEIFILGLESQEINESLKKGEISHLTPHIYRVQRLSSWYYDFKRHDSTISATDNIQMENNNYIRVNSEGKFKSLNPTKIRINLLGQISLNN